MLTEVTLDSWRDYDMQLWLMGQRYEYEISSVAKKDLGMPKQWSTPTSFHSGIAV